MSYALVIAYRGARYSGWQRQQNALSVQQVVEEALSSLLEEEVRIHGAGRTDAGVHARGQVAHFALNREFPQDGLLHGTNQRLPDDIRVMLARRVPSDFHARKAALSKEYRYRLMRTRILSPLDALFAVRVQPGLDLDAVQAATASLIGSHDFSAFALAGGGHGQPVRRILSANWVETGAQLELRLVGDGFLRGMVRSLVGTLLEVGSGRMDPATFASLLEGGSRADAGPTAPAHGLVLQEVHYPADFGHWKSRSGHVGMLD